MPRAASWKQTLAEAALRREPLAHVTPSWVAHDSLDDIEFRINAKMRLELPVVQRGLCQHQRRPKADGTAWAHFDEKGHHAQKCLIGGAMWVATSYACCEAGLKSQREVIVPTLATEKLTEPRVDVDAWWHPGLLHIPLDFTGLDAEALHWQPGRLARTDGGRCRSGERS